MADDGLPPPLEDMTATLEQAKKLRDLRLGTQDRTTTTRNTTTSAVQIQNVKAVTEKKSPAAPPSTTAAPVSQSQTKSSTTTTPTPDAAENTKSTPNAKSESGDFGGMKKGFLFGGGSKASASTGKQQARPVSGKNNTAKNSAAVPTESIPFIKPQTQDKHSGLKLDDVQKAMDSTKGFLQDKDWVTDDLLEKVQKNDTLFKRMGDPRFMQAVTEFQMNPKEAMEKYQSNPEMQQFLKEFCGILGEHFSSIGEKQDQQNSAPTQNPSKPTYTGPKITEINDEDQSSSHNPQVSSAPVDPHVQKILADPANRDILMDPKIQQFIQHLHSDPEKAQKMLREGDAGFRQNIDRMVSLGLLKFQA